MFFLCFQMIITNQTLYVSAKPLLCCLISCPSLVGGVVLIIFAVIVARHVAHMMLILFRADGLQVSHQHRVSISLMFEEGCVVLYVIHAREYFLEVAESVLFFLEIKDYLHIVFS
jgi:hypothetical protein